MSALEGIGFMLLPGLLLIPRMGVQGFMLTLIISYALLALVGPVYAIIYWKRMPKTLREWVTIPADFGAPESECMDASIHSLEEAVNTAKEVNRFCLERSIDKKKANCAALALEELCLGIIKERFETDPKKKHTIELRVIHKGEDIFMSMKDDCKPFNPKERSELVNPQDDSPKSLSIRVFMGVVKETEYHLTLGMNVFTVTV
jgi:anti-sigma regulatory factor (Ser/Thr protein kinase)